MVEQSFGAWLGQLASQAMKVLNPVLITNAPRVPTAAFPTYTALPVLVKALYDGRFKLRSNLKLIS